MKREATIEEIKRIQLNMLSVLHKFCEENNLTYYLSAGTLLGAVRHKGYIPWDDDIDICMPRADYMRFLSEYNDNPLDKNLKVVSIESEKDYYLPFAKMINQRTILCEECDTDFEIGVYLDIFPLDNMSSDYRNAKRLLYQVERWRNILMIKNLLPSPQRARKKNALIKIGKVLFYGVSRRRILKKIDTLSRKYENNQKSEYCGAVCDAIYGEGEIMPSDWFAERVLVNFEGLEFFAPAKYENVLKNLYNDYMELPPIDKRCSHHRFKVVMEE